jgi:hypothetical protein
VPPSYGGNRFASLERTYRETGEARNVLILALKTGWSEADIRGMPLERRNSYIRELNDLYSK